MNTEKTEFTREAAEMGVIGSMLLDHDIAKEIIAIAKPEHFKTHRNVFEVIAAHFKRAGKFPDVIGVRDDLITAGEYERIGGKEVLAAILSSVPSSSDGLAFARTLAEW